VKDEVKYLNDKPHRSTRWQVRLDVAASAAMLAAAIVIFWFAGWTVMKGGPSSTADQVARSTEPLPTKPIPIGDAATKGNARASIALIEFADFECPVCGRFARDVLPVIDQTYIATGKVLYVFRHLPLEQIHSNAFGAAVVSECARVQGKFWPMYATLFERSQQLDRTSLMGQGKKVGLDLPNLEACMAGQAAQQIRKDLALGKTLAISATPTFFIGRLLENGEVAVVSRLRGLLPAEMFSRALDDALAAAQKTQ
jgi:protein-disulfide isomerase